MNLIASVDRNWAIGKNNRLLVSIPSDMKFFREITLNKIVIAGRKTLETFQNGIPLRDRENVILTRNEEYSVKRGYVVHSLDETFSVLEELYQKGYSSKDVFVVGGSSVYQQLEPYCDTAYVTKIDREYDADAFFPDLDASRDWKLVEHGDEQTYFDLEYAVLKYKRISG